MVTPRPIVTLAVVLLLSGTASSCGASLPTSTEAAATNTAQSVCGLLRDWSNEMVVSMNATSDAITADDDPTTAGGVLLDGFDELIDIAERHIAEVDDLALPVSAERDRLLDDLETGAEAAVAELEDERSTFEDLPPITVDEQRGVLGGAFTTLEKAQSLVEPEVVKYDDAAIRAAFNDEPSCEHVVQSF